MLSTTLDQRIVALDQRLRGDASGPADPRYDALRRVDNAVFDAHPAVIARCLDAGDVNEALRFATGEGLDVAIRGGGHSLAGFGSVNGGLVVDLSSMRRVQVDPAARTARVAGGATAADLDRATQPFGLATPSATVSSVGVAGFTLGGGLGYLNRAHGLAVDNLVGATLVLADGAVVETSEEREPELLWALRGGGGNFGVVTEMVFRLHAVSIVNGGPMIWALDATEQIVDLYRDWLPQQPDDIYAFLAILTVPPVDPFPEPFRLRKACALMWCNTAPAERSSAAMDTFRAGVPPMLDGVGELPYAALQASFDSLAKPGLRGYSDGLVIDRLPEGAGRAYRHHGEAMPTPLSQTHVYPIDGAAGRPAMDATAWPWRDATFVQMITGLGEDRDEDAVLARWVTGFSDDLRGWARDGTYSNFLMDHGREVARAAYGTNYGRLADLKRRYDPGNVFHVNQNIEPVAV